MNCGVEQQTFDCSSVQFVYPRGHEIQVKTKQPYARSKRFAKYLARAGREQSLSSVPNETWSYLLKHQPYSGPGDILFTLKRSNLKTKCYDSLPLLTKQLCGCSVPRLTTRESEDAMIKFNQIEAAFPNGSKFVSSVPARVHSHSDRAVGHFTFSEPDPVHQASQNVRRENHIIRCPIAMVGSCVVKWLVL